VHFVKDVERLKAILGQDSNKVTALKNCAAEAKNRRFIIHHKDFQVVPLCIRVLNNSMPTRSSKDHDFT
jgi:hypothetical protein